LFFVRVDVYEEKFIEIISAKEILTSNSVHPATEVLLENLSTLQDDIVKGKIVLSFPDGFAYQSIDITKEPLSGTSFAAPKMLAWIDKIHNNVCSDLTAQEILQAVRNATPNNPRTPMSYKKLESEAKKLCRQENFLITSTSVGLIKKGMSIDEMRKLWSNNNSIKPKEYFDFEFSYVCYELQDANNRLLALIPTPDCLCGNYLQAMHSKDNAPIIGIGILDQRYRTSKGIGLGSTFGELKKFYKIDEILDFAYGYDFLQEDAYGYYGNDENNDIVSVTVNELNATFGIQKKYLLSDWDSYNGYVDISKIPDTAPIYSLTITWNDLLSTDEDDPNIGKVLEYFTKADDAYLKGNYDEAIQYYRRILHICPEHPYAYYGMGDSYLFSNNHSQAVKCFNKVLEIDPQDSYIFLGLGIAFSNIKDYNQAIKCYKRAIEIRQNYLEAYNNLGIVLTNLKDYNQAISYYKKAIEIDPKFSLAYHNLGYVYKNLKDNSTATYYYNKAAELDPNYAVHKNKLKQAKEGNKAAQLWLRDNGYYW
jgi:tetratricopeptide (TPR) repeat protein